MHHLSQEAMIKELFFAQHLQKKATEKVATKGARAWHAWDHTSNMENVCGVCLFV